MVVDAYNLSMGEVEAGRSGAQDHLATLWIWDQPKLDYTPYFKNQTKKEKAESN